MRRKYLRWVTTALAWRSRADSRLARLPPGVVLKDFGIRGFDLAYALLDPYDLILLVDACPRGGEPGTVYLIEPDRLDMPAQDAAPPRLDAHGMDPMSVFAYGPVDGRRAETDADRRLRAR